MIFLPFPQPTGPIPPDRRPWWKVILYGLLGGIAIGISLSILMLPLTTQEFLGRPFPDWHEAGRMTLGAVWVCGLGGLLINVITKLICR